MYYKIEDKISDFFMASLLAMIYVLTAFFANIIYLTVTNRVVEEKMIDGLSIGFILGSFLVFALIGTVCCIRRIRKVGDMAWYLDRPKLVVDDIILSYSNVIGCIFVFLAVNCMISVAGAVLIGLFKTCMGEDIVKKFAEGQYMFSGWVFGCIVILFVYLSAKGAFFGIQKFLDWKYGSKEKKNYEMLTLEEVKQLKKLRDSGELYIPGLYDFKKIVFTRENWGEFLDNYKKRREQIAKEQDRRFEDDFDDK